MPGRRLFIHQVAATACLVVARNAFAESPMLSPSEPAAQALGYTADATQTDRKKFPNYAPGDRCSACAIFVTRIGENSGTCPLFPDRMVAADGWCNAFSVAI